MADPTIPTEAPHVLLSADGRYVRGIDPQGRELITRDQSKAWAVDKSYAYRLKTAYQLSKFRVVPFGP